MKIAYITLGCKVNQYETQAMERLLSAAGHETSAPKEADAIIVNTCAVTGESARKSRQTLRRMKKNNPSARLVVCGCFSQADAPAALECGADYVGGAGERNAVVDYLNEISEAMKMPPDPLSRRTFEELPAGAADGHARALLKIQDGCSNFCSYCIIPYLRGRPRSLSVESACASVKNLARDGFGEIVITGIEISSYGVDIGSDLFSLAEAVGAAAEPARIRLGSLEPSVMTDAAVSRLAKIPNLCPHFHLSLQSGSAGVLMRMRRKYTPAEYLAAAERLRNAFCDPAITTDLIVGFPGETEAEFLESLTFIEAAGFAAVHIFPYSRRIGTRAADMPGHIANAEKERRVRLASEAAAKTRAAYLHRQTGKSLRVLFETSDGENNTGHSENYLEVTVSGGENPRGKTLPVKITGVFSDGLVGEVQHDN